MTTHDCNCDSEWMASGECRNVTDLDLFFPERGGDAEHHYANARAVCDRCPVKAECLAWADVHMEKFGMWGGLTPRERSRRRASLRRTTGTTGTTTTTTRTTRVTLRVYGGAA